MQDLLEDEEKAMELETKLENDGEADIETSDGVMKILRPMVQYFKVKKKVQEENMYHLLLNHHSVLGVSCIQFWNNHL